MPITVTYASNVLEMDCTFTDTESDLDGNTISNSSVALVPMAAGSAIATTIKAGTRDETDPKAITVTVEADLSGLTSASNGDYQPTATGIADVAGNVIDPIASDIVTINL